MTRPRTKETEVLRLAVRIAKAETDEQILAYGRQIQQLLKK